VLGLAITTHLFPLLDASTYGAGRLTKIRAQAVSGRSCRAVADRLGLHGFEQTAQAVREAFAPEIELALERPADFKSALQERLARRGAVVNYEVTAESGPPHERIFEVAAVVSGNTVAHGSGRSKKEAEQAAAAAALEAEVEA
jgi:ribonuclease-3